MGTERGRGERGREGRGTQLNKWNERRGRRGGRVREEEEVESGKKRRERWREAKGGSMKRNPTAMRYHLAASFLYLYQLPCES